MLLPPSVYRNVRPQISQRCHQLQKITAPYLEDQVNYQVNNTEMIYFSLKPT